MSDAPLAGRCALVTGAAKRTGRALAIALADAGADVAVHYRNSAAEAKLVAEAIRERGRRSLSVQGDLIDCGQAEQVTRRVADELGRLDILVNNVGAIVWKDLDELTPEDWRAGIDGTLTVTYHACRAALPLMRSQRYGRIINILDADSDALAPVIHATPYKIGKTGSLVLTKSLAKNEAPYGITVNAVSPGVLDDSQKEVPLGRIPAGRVGTAADLAGAVLFLAREDSGYLTGSNLKVSGGYLI
jgi:NAD(P)-dependent dehydrogenase (short-subunit alcohol dehydrogenase family)